MLYNKFNFALKNFVSKNSGIKPEIQGIFVSPKETCATDSFRMMVVSAVRGFNIKEYPLPKNSRHKKPISNFKPFILPPDTAEKVVKVFPTGKDRNAIGIPIVQNAIVVRDKKDEVEIGRNYLEGFESISSHTIEGKFPEYSKLLGDDGKYNEVVINVKYLKDTIDFLEKFVNEHDTKVFIRVDKDPLQPVKITGFRNNGGEAGELQKAVAVIMPLKL